MRWESWSRKRVLFALRCIRMSRRGYRVYRSWAIGELVGLEVRIQGSSCNPDVAIRLGDCLSAPSRA